MKKKTSSPSYEEFCSSIYYDGTTKIPNLIINHRKIHKENGCYDLSPVEDGIDVFFGYIFILNKDEYDVLRGENVVEFEKLFQTAKILSEKEENIAAKLFYYSLLLYGPGEDKEEVIKSLENISKSNEDNLDLTFGCASSFILKNYYSDFFISFEHFFDGILKYIKILADTNISVFKFTQKSKSNSNTEKARKALKAIFDECAYGMRLTESTEYVDISIDALKYVIDRKDELDKLSMTQEEVLDLNLTSVTDMNLDEVGDSQYYIRYINRAKKEFTSTDSNKSDLFTDEKYQSIIKNLYIVGNIDENHTIDGVLDSMYETIDETKPTKRKALNEKSGAELFGELIKDENFETENVMTKLGEKQSSDNKLGQNEMHGFYQQLFTTFKKRRSYKLNHEESLSVVDGIIRDVDGEKTLGLLFSAYKDNTITPHSYLTVINKSFLESADTNKIKDEVKDYFGNSKGENISINFSKSILDASVKSIDEVGANEAAKILVEIYDKSIEKGVTDQKTVDGVIDGYEVKNESDLDFKIDVYKNQAATSSEDKKKNYEDKIRKEIDAFTTTTDENGKEEVDWNKRLELTKKYLGEEAAHEVVESAPEGLTTFLGEKKELDEIIDVKDEKGNEISLTAKDANGKNWYDKIIGYKFGKREGDIIDVISDYGWSANTFKSGSSNKGHNKENNIPFCYAIEYQQLYNASISNIIQSLVGLVSSTQHVVEGGVDIISGIFGKLTGFLIKIAVDTFKSDSAVNGTPLDGESVGNEANKNIEGIGDRVKGHVNKVGEYLNGIIARFTRTGQSPVATGSGLLAPYLLMYCVKPTNRKYCFPMLDKSSSYFKAVNKMEEKDGGMGSAILGRKLFSTIANAGRTMMGIAEDLEQIAPFLVGDSVTDGGTRQYHIERSKYFSYPSDGEEIETSFVLYNTVKQNIWKDHYKFIMGFMLRNLPFKYDVVAYYPPLFYDVHVPGVKRCPFCYVDNFDVSPLGLTRTLKISGKDFGIGADNTLYSVNVPEAWMIKVKFKSLLATSSNQILSGFIDTPITSNVNDGSPENKTTQPNT